MNKGWQVEAKNMLEAGGSKPAALYTWVYRVVGYAKGVELREYLAGTAGRIRVRDVRAVADALNEYSLTTGEGR